MSFNLNFVSTLESKMFSGNKESDPVVSPLVYYAGAALGAIIGVASAVMMASSNESGGIPLLISMTLLLAMAAGCVVDAFYRVDSVGKASARAAYNILFLAICFAIGFALSVIVIIVLVALLALYLISAMLSGGGSSGKTKYRVNNGLLGFDEDLVHEGGDNYRGKYSGTHYVKEGDKFYEG